MGSLYLVYLLSINRDDFFVISIKGLASIHFFLTFYQENRIGSIIFGLFILSINWDDFVGLWLRFGSLKKTQSYLKNFHSWKQKVGYILIYI